MKILEFKTLFKYFTKKSFIIIIVALVFCGFQYIKMDKNEIIKYSAEASVLLLSDTTNDEYEFYKQNASDLCEKIVKSSSVIKKVINELDLDYSVQQISNNITTQTNNNGEIIKIQYVNMDKNETVQIVNAIANSFAKKMDSLYEFNNVEVLDEADTFNILVSNSKKDIFMQIFKMFVAGSVVGLGIIFIMYYFDTTIKSSEEFNELDLNILGEFSRKNNYIKILAINLSNIIKRKNLKKIIITSTLKTDNKFSIVSKLAISLTNLGHKVLVVNFDSLNNQSCLDDIVIKNDTNNKQIINTNIKNLSFVSCESSNLNEINTNINNFSKEYDIVLINSQNINESAKGLIVCNIGDGIIFIEKLNKTKQEQLKKAFNYLKQTNLDILGVVINK